MEMDNGVDPGCCNIYGCRYWEVPSNIVTTRSTMKFISPSELQKPSNRPQNNLGNNKG